MQGINSIPAFRLPSTNTVITYLCIMGVLASLALIVALLLFIAYLTQILLMSIGEVVSIFNSFDPVVRFLLLSLFGVLIAWRYSAHMKARAGYGY